jgi:hypothetical protein
MKGRIPPNKGIPMSEEQKEKIRATKKANPYIKTAEDSLKQSLAQTGTKRSAETKQKMSASAKGKPKGPMSKDEKIKRSIALKGKPKSADAIAKRATTLKNLAAEGTHHSMIKLTCPHCGAEMQKLLYARYHGARCKSLQQP